MDELVTWLRALIDEDERIAHAAAGGPWERDARNRWIWGKQATAVVADPGIVEANAEHIARHDPARVLREVEAKRRTLARHAPVSAWDGKVCCDRCSVLSLSVYQDWPCPDVRDLAAEFADQPGYRDEWKPAS